MYLLCIGASRGFAFVEFNATQEAARWMEMKQVERSSVQIPKMRCHTRATDCPVAARHGNAALWPSPWPRLCTYKKLFQSTVSNYLSRNPHIFCRLFLIRSQYSRIIGLSLQLTEIPSRRVLLSVYHKSSWSNDEDRRRVIPVVLYIMSF